MKDNCNIDKNYLAKVAGGARPMEKTYEFHCQRCGDKWTLLCRNPNKFKGCPNCGKEFIIIDGEESPYDECVEYDPVPKPVR